MDAVFIVGNQKIAIKKDQWSKLKDTNFSIYQENLSLESQNPKIIISDDHSPLAVINILRYLLGHDKELKWHHNEDKSLEEIKKFNKRTKKNEIQFEPCTHEQYRKKMEQYQKEMKHYQLNEEMRIQQIKDNIKVQIKNQIEELKFWCVPLNRWNLPYHISEYTWDIIQRKLPFFNSRIETNSRIYFPYFDNMLNLFILDLRSEILYKVNYPFHSKKQKKLKTIKAGNRKVYQWTIDWQYYYLLVNNSGYYIITYDKDRFKIYQVTLEDCDSYCLISQKEKIPLNFHKQQFPSTVNCCKGVKYLNDFTPHYRNCVISDSYFLRENKKFFQGFFNYPNFVIFFVKVMIFSEEGDGYKLIDRLEDGFISYTLINDKKLEYSTSICFAEEIVDTQLKEDGDYQILVDESRYLIIDSQTNIIVKCGNKKDRLYSIYCNYHSKYQFIIKRSNDEIEVTDLISSKAYLFIDKTEDEKFKLRKTLNRDRLSFTESQILIPDYKIIHSYRYQVNNQIIDNQESQKILTVEYQGSFSLEVINEKFSFYHIYLIAENDSFYAFNDSDHYYIIKSLLSL